MAVREVWLDSAKGIGILLVVAAHITTEGSKSWEPAFTQAVFLFHMPLFFVISGYLFRPVSRNDLFWKKVGGLLIPYGAFLIALTVAVLLRRMALHDTPAPWELRSMASDALFGGMHLVRDFGVFWFIPCLFVTQLLYNEIIGLTSRPDHPGAIACMVSSTLLAYAISTFWPQNFSPWAIAAVPLALPCYWFGHLLRTNQFRFVVQLAFVVVVCLAAVIAKANGLNLEFNMKYSIFGPPLLGLLLALSLSLAFLSGVRVLTAQSKVGIGLASLGEASLVIMFLHQFVHYSLRDFGVTSDVLLLLVTVSASYASYLVLKRSPTLAPWFLGTGTGLSGRLLGRVRHSLSWRITEYVSPMLDSIARLLATLLVHTRWLIRREGRASGLSGELIVSLTSYPPRFPTLALTIKCLLTQTVRADRTILWIAARDLALLPSSVTDLKADGLEIRLAKDTRSYKKIIPALVEFPQAYLVTADDDVYYSSRWLSALVTRAKEFLGEPTIVCHRAHSITYDIAGKIQPYTMWDPAVRDDTKMLFPTGVGGVLYSPNSLAPEVVEESQFMRLCPHADDVWLFWMGLRAGSRYLKASTNWAPIAWTGTQTAALHVSNVAGNGNDAQIENMVRVYGSPTQIAVRRNQSGQPNGNQGRLDNLPGGLQGRICPDQIIAKIQDGLADRGMLTSDECRSLLDRVVGKGGSDDPQSRRRGD